MVRCVIMRSLKDVLLVENKYIDTKGEGATDMETEKQMFGK